MSLKEMSTRTAMVLVAAGLVLFLAAGWFLLISPKRSEAAQLQNEIEATRVLLAAPIPEPEPAAEVEAASERLVRAMPDVVSMPAVVLDLHRIAGEAGVRLDAITPSEPVAHPTYQTQPISVMLEGSFFGFSDFLRRLRSQARVVDGEVQGEGRIYAVDSITFAESPAQFPSLVATLMLSTVFAPTAPAAPVGGETDESGDEPVDAATEPSTP